MRFLSVLRSAFRLLIRRPVLFIPRLLDAAVWSWFWLTAADSLTDPASMTVSQLQSMLAFLIIMLPIQVWLYNSYFIIVRQYHNDEIDMIGAFRDGLLKLPEGLGAFLIPFILGTVLAVPGTVLFTAGITTGQLPLQAAGIVLAVTAVIGTGVIFYFAPVSVVLGDNGFLQEFKNGFRASRNNTRSVLLITLISFGILGLTTVLEGGLERLGMIGFILGRLLTAVVSLYILLVNPTFLLEVENE